MLGLTKLLVMSNLKNKEIKIVIYIYYYIFHMGHLSLSLFVN